MSVGQSISQFQAGRFIKQPSGYQSFMPEKVNRQWIVDHPETEALVAEANRKLGELNGYSQLVQEIDFFISMYKALEATTSSRIEGTQTTVEEAFLKQEEVRPEHRDDWQEVQNYLAAMNFAIAELERLPLSNRLIRETHRVLMQGVRGAHKQPGEFRQSQNWIGGATLRDASFVPPPPAEVPALMGDLELFLHNSEIHVNELVRIAIAHYQFETIHPFLDGNGRTGRLLITLYLVSTGLLKRPSLYLSGFFDRHRILYYDHLTRTRTHHELNQWLKFFMVGVIETSESSIQNFRDITLLREDLRKRLLQLDKRYANAVLLLNYLFKKPITNAAEVIRELKISPPTAHRLLAEFVRLGILAEVTGYQRNRSFRFSEYLGIFER
jgi:Fic family protein